MPCLEMEKKYYRSVIPQSKRKLNNFENTVENHKKGQAPELLVAANGKISQNNQNINSKMSAAVQLRLKAGHYLISMSLLISQ